MTKGSGKRRVHFVWSLVLIVCLLVAGWLGGMLANPALVQSPTMHSTSTPLFQPHVGDVGDMDDSMTVALGTLPTFQFVSGGYPLVGITVDARTGQVIGGASVWLSVPPVLGQRTAPVLRSVSTLAGTFSFQHLATGQYNLAAARYAVQQGQAMYPEIVITHVHVPQQNRLRLALNAQSAPGKRVLLSGVARNLVMLDLSGIYAESWFDDPALASVTSDVRRLAAMGASATQVVAPYGWHPTDQYALLSGTYPAWRVYDPWPAVPQWGLPDGMDTPFWYNSDLFSMQFGQESLFDVARSYGMSTAALGGQAYALSDVSTRGVQTAQVGLAFDSSTWLVAAQHMLENMRANSNGFVFYSELDPPFGQAGTAGAAPDAPGGAYAQAMQMDDELLALLRAWLSRENLLQNTVILVTASEAQVNETAFDNYYGMGPGGVGSSLHVPLVMAGPGIASGTTVTPLTSSFAIASTALRALCLPSIANARAMAITAFFSNACS